MNIFAQIAMFGWLAVVPLMFVLMPARRAVVVCVLSGWLFLPNAGYDLSGLPDYTKLSATTVVVLLWALLLDFPTLSRLRPAWFDVPMVVWCLCPMVSSVTAGYGVYDGVSSVLNQLVPWGAPYMLGRAYFRDLGALRELAVAVFVSALVYLPLVAFEIRMSPQLHSWLYGFHQHDFAQSRRGESWRPTVFLQHGLAVAMFMGTAGTIGFWLWRSRSVAALGSMPMSWLAALVLGITLLCNSIGAAALMLLGCAGLWATRVMRARWLLAAIVAFPLVYITSRGLLGWKGEQLITLAGEINEWRAASLRVRLTSENGVLSRMGTADALFGESRFIFGGEQVEEGGPIIVPDGYWIIALVKFGSVGLMSMTAVLILPCAVCLRRWPVQAWSDPAIAPAAALAVVVAASMIDNLFNAMINPLFPLAAGGVMTAVTAVPVWQARLSAATAVPLSAVAAARTERP